MKVSTWNDFQLRLMEWRLRDELKRWNQDYQMAASLRNDLVVVATERQKRQEKTK